MGVELDLSELAVLRPIQTTSAGSGGGATAARRGGNDDLDAADTGCVTPTAMSSLLPRQVGFGVGVGVGIGIGIDAVESVVFSTPTASPCLLRPATVCPPAPRKPARSPAAAAKRKRCCDRSAGLQRPFFFPVPQDLSTVFVPRGPADSRSPPPRAAKKVRRLFVVG